MGKLSRVKREQRLELKALTPTIGSDGRSYVQDDSGDIYFVIVEPSERKMKFSKYSKVPEELQNTTLRVSARFVRVYEAQKGSKSTQKVFKRADTRAIVNPPDFASNKESSGGP